VSADADVTKFREVHTVLYLGELLGGSLRQKGKQGTKTGLCKT
jgi:hypothetical protein